MDKFNSKTDQYVMQCSFPETATGHPKMHMPYYITNKNQSMFILLLILNQKFSF